MKIGTLCKVTSKESHYPSQHGDLIVVTGILGKTTNTGGHKALSGRNLKTGKEHHYFAKEIEEVKKCP